jgi:hypothetical protein
MCILFDSEMSQPVSRKPILGFSRPANSVPSGTGRAATRSPFAFRDRPRDLCVRLQLVLDERHDRVPLRSAGSFCDVLLAPLRPPRAHLGGVGRHLPELRLPGEHLRPFLPRQLLRAAGLVRCVFDATAGAAIVTFATAPPAGPVAAGRRPWPDAARRSGEEPDGRPRCGEDGEDEPGGERGGDAESNSGGTGERASQIS